MSHDRTDRRADDKRVISAERAAYDALARVDGLDRHISTLQTTITADIGTLRQEIRGITNRPQNIAGWVGTALLVISLQGASLAFMLGQIQDVRDDLQGEVTSTDMALDRIMQRELEDAERRGIQIERTRQLEQHIENIDAKGPRVWFGHEVGGDGG